MCDRGNRERWTFGQWHLHQHWLQGKNQLFDRWAPQYDLIFPSVVYQAIHLRMLDHVQLPPEAHVLDLGCGTGKLLNRLAQHDATLTGVGLDFAAEMIHQARQKSVAPDRLTYIEGRSDDLPFDDQQFDAVFCSISLLHYADPAAALAEVYRVLKPEASFYWSDFTPWKTFSGTLTLPITPGGVYLYSLDERERLGKAAGFTGVAHHYLLGQVALTILTKYGGSHRD